MRFRLLNLLVAGITCVTACDSLRAQSNIVLSVDRTTGAASLRNDGDAIGDFDGYAIQSDFGSITPGSWNSLEDQAVSDWLEAGTPSVNFLSELKATTQSSLAPGGSQAIGSVYNAAAAMQAAGLGNDNYEDLVFTLNNPLGAEGPETTNPPVVYSGVRAINNLVLTLNRETGAAVIENQSLLTVALDGYAFTSATGSLNTAWNSLQDQGVGDWVEGGSNSANVLTELKPTTSTSLATGATLTLANAFNPAAGALAAGFGVDPEDVAFSFGDVGLDDSIVGVVQYEGEKTFNNLVINVDVGTGDVTIENESPHTVSIDGYTIASPAGTLDPNALVSLGGTFVDANSSATRISELDPVSGLTLNPAATVSLGNIYLGGTQDLAFEFDFQALNSTSLDGVVKYVGGVDGDFDQSGRVDGFDLLLWQRGSSPDPFSAGDLQDWAGNYGDGNNAAAAVSAVPEPTGVLLMATAAAAIATARRRGGAIND